MEITKNGVDICFLVVNPWQNRQILYEKQLASAGHQNLLNQFHHKDENLKHRITSSYSLIAVKPVSSTALF